MRAVSLSEIFGIRAGDLVLAPKGSQDALEALPIERPTHLRRPNQCPCGLISSLGPLIPRAARCAPLLAEGTRRTASETNSGGPPRCLLWRHTGSDKQVQ